MNDILIGFLLFPTSLVALWITWRLFRATSYAIGMEWKYIKAFKMGCRMKPGYSGFSFLYLAPIGLCGSFWRGLRGKDWSYTLEFIDKQGNLKRI